MSRAISTLLLGFVVLMVLAAPPAQATSFDLNVINCNCLLAGTSAGTVSVTGGGSQVTISVQLAAGLHFHDAGLTSFAFNFAPTGGASIDSITPSEASWYAGTGGGQGGAANTGGLGNFTYYYDCVAAPNGCNPNLSAITFTIAGSGLTEAMFETVGSGGVDFSANVAVASASGCTGTVGGGNGTVDSQPSGGYAAGSARETQCGAPTPEPTSIAFFGTGLIALGFVIRRRFVSQS